LVNFRLDFVSTIKIFFSLELSFRAFQSGVTQPLKTALLLRRWQPSWLIHIVQHLQGIGSNVASDRNSIDIDKDTWLTKETVCSVPVHLDITAAFGIALFIVMSNSTR
jgi:hypothetical protein